MCSASPILPNKLRRICWAVDLVAARWQHCHNRQAAKALSMCVASTKSSPCPASLLKLLLVSSNLLLIPSICWPNCLQTVESERHLEQDLLDLLDYDKFDLVKELKGNRLTIVWCTRLARAENEDVEQRIQVHLLVGRSAPSATSVESMGGREPQPTSCWPSMTQYYEKRCKCHSPFCTVSPCHFGNWNGPMLCCLWAGPALGPGDTVTPVKQMFSSQLLHTSFLPSGCADGNGGAAGDTRHPGGAERGPRLGPRPADRRALADRGGGAPPAVRQRCRCAAPYCCLLPVMLQLLLLPVLLLPLLLPLLLNSHRSS